jgi:GTP-binding protein
MESNLKPVVAILGRPNVGKSTLFNRLTKTRDALVADVAGVTRDVNVGTGKLGQAAYLVADTGGIDSAAKGNMNARVSQQALGIVRECDALVLLVDAKEGVNSEDEYIAQAIRKTGMPVYLVVNKVDGSDPDLVSIEFARLGLNQPIPISALTGNGVTELIAKVTVDWAPASAYEPESGDDRIRVAIVGRPNVGKSTLVNRMLGEERMITADLPGTTHDSVATDFERRSKRYTLIDTAGLRRRGRVTDIVEKFSAVKALQAIDLAAVVVVVLDATEAVTDQDAHLLGLVLESGRSVVVAVNKWDGLNSDKRDQIRRELDRKLKFIDYAERVFISALHGTGVGGLFDNILQAWRSSQITASTSAVTEMLNSATNAHPPPLVRGRRVKLRYAHFGGRNPPTIIVHGNQTKALPESYRRYLANYFRDIFKLVGTPVRIEFKEGKNPYAHKRNTLTPRQAQSKRRLMKHVKRK